MVFHNLVYLKARPFLHWYGVRLPDVEVDFFESPDGRTRFSGGVALPGVAIEYATGANIDLMTTARISPL